MTMQGFQRPITVMSALRSIRDRSYLLPAIQSAGRAIRGAPSLHRKPGAVTETAGFPQVGATAGVTADVPGVAGDSPLPPT